MKRDPNKADALRRMLPDATFGEPGVYYPTSGRGGTNIDTRSLSGNVGMGLQGSTQFNPIKPIEEVNKQVIGLGKSAYNAATGRPLNPFIKQSLGERAFGLADMLMWLIPGAQTAKEIAAVSADNAIAKAAMGPRISETRAQALANALSERRINEAKAAFDESYHKMTSDPMANLNHTNIHENIFNRPGGDAFYYSPPSGYVDYYHTNSSGNPLPPKLKSLVEVSGEAAVEDVGRRNASSSMLISGGLYGSQDAALSSTYMNAPVAYSGNNIGYRIPDVMLKEPRLHPDIAIEDLHPTVNRVPGVGTTESIMGNPRVIDDASKSGENWFKSAIDIDSPINSTQFAVGNGAEGLFNAIGKNTGWGNLNEKILNLVENKNNITWREFFKGLSDEEARLVVDHLPAPIKLESNRVFQHKLDQNILRDAYGNYTNKVVTAPGEPAYIYNPNSTGKSSDIFSDNFSEWRPRLQGFTTGDQGINRIRVQFDPETRTLNNRPYFDVNNIEHSQLKETSDALNFIIESWTPPNVLRKYKSYENPHEFPWNWSSERSWSFQPQDAERLSNLQNAKEAIDDFVRILSQPPNTNSWGRNSAVKNSVIQAAEYISKINGQPVRQLVDELWNELAVVYGNRTGMESILHPGGAGPRGLRPHEAVVFNRPEYLPPSEFIPFGPTIGSLQEAMAAREFGFNRAAQLARMAEDIPARQIYESRMAANRLRSAAQSGARQVGIPGFARQMSQNRG